MSIEKLPAAKQLADVLAIISPSLFGPGGVVRAYVHPVLRTRWEMMRWAFSYTACEEVDGDYLEFGVASGRSLIFAKRNARAYPTWKRDGEAPRFFGFDSFEGFPKSQGRDAIFYRFKEGDEHFDLDTVRKNIKRGMGSTDDVFLIAGWFDKTLTKDTVTHYKIKRARVVLVDCDLYESTKLALNFVTPLLQEGTVIIYDDWLAFRARADRGEQMATAEWLEENPSIRLVPFHRYGEACQSFIVNID
jgi:O-methyltransferase